METPKSARQLRPQRNPTPRLSERKKSLFSTGKALAEHDDLLEGITALDTSHEDQCSDKQRSTLQATPHTGAHRGRAAAATEAGGERTPTQRRSLRFARKSGSSSPGEVCDRTRSALAEAKGKENLPLHTRMEEGADDDLRQLFSHSMRLGGQQTGGADDQAAVRAAERGGTDELAEQRDNSYKRQYELTSPVASPKRKMARTDAICIPTKAFYSTSRTPTTTTTTSSSTGSSSMHTRGAVISASPGGSSTSPRGRRSERRTATQHTINKGVRHKIRKRPGVHSMRMSTCLDIDDILSHVRNEKLRKLITDKREEKQQIEKVHNIFRAGHNPIEMARPLSALNGMADDSNNNNNNNVPDAQSCKYAVQEADFSDIECDSGDELAPAEAVIQMISHSRDGAADVDAQPNGGERAQTPSGTRKFFKSGYTIRTRKEVKITEHIRASVCNGKISLVQQDKRPRRKPIRSTAASNEFSDEQATVDQILKNLDDISFTEHLEMAQADPAPQLTEQQAAQPDDAADQPRVSATESDQQDCTSFSEFRSRLPYNTTDPELMDQQHLLLDFLISNDICTEENFTIFIADPDNHKEAASRIVDQVVEIVNEQANYRQRIPYNTDDPELIAQQHSFLDYLVENNICTEENFDIFIANYEQRYNEAEQIVANLSLPLMPPQPQTPSPPPPPPKESAVAEDAAGVATETTATQQLANEEPMVHCDNVEAVPVAEKDEIRPAGATAENLFPIFYPGRCQPLAQLATRRTHRVWGGGTGANQYQIDAGQRSFGAHQCKQCGLVYTVHEPEEEKLHRDFHASLHVLRFKGWIDEDIVAIYPEWGADGRILRVTESSNSKRRERLMDILKIVDKELGFSSYIFPKTFVAYLAVRKCQIVGICLVQPLDKANKYLCVEGVDYCSEEEFEAKCGISRVWVSPLHRRLHIATKLIDAVRINTIFGEDIPVQKIAFSAPTENGRIFAQQVTGLENFLVYQ